MDKNTIDYYQNIKSDFLVSDESIFRYGSIGDGGYYLRPNTILESNVLFSGGISSNLEFEYDLYRLNPELKVIMIDPTVSGVKLLFKGIIRFFLSKPDKIRYLFNALIFNYLIKSSRCIHKKIWLNKDQSILELVRSNFNTDEKILLKLDIEGSEYDFLEELLLNLNSFSAMVFEFHEMDLKHHLVNDFLTKCSSHFKLVHLSINPSGGFDSNKRPKNIEISLERLD